MILHDILKTLDWCFLVVQKFKEILLSVTRKNIQREERILYSNLDQNHCALRTSTLKKDLIGAEKIQMRILRSLR